MALRRDCRLAPDAPVSERGFGCLAHYPNIQTITNDSRSIYVSATRAGEDAATRRGRGLEPHVLLLTGTPGVGKTTVIRRVAGQLEAKGLRGFYTEEIREQGERKGFRLVSLDGKTRVVAHVQFSKDRQVGRYGVDVAAVDEAASLLAPDPGARVYIVDEIGKMECFSQRFITALRVLLAGSTPVVATVGQRGGGFIAEVKRSRACLLWQVTRANRDELPARVLAWLAQTAYAGRPSDVSD